MVTSAAVTNALLALLTALPLITANGCYKGGLALNDLHGGTGDNGNLDGEVLADINTVCNMVNGAVFKKGDPPFSHCSEWAVPFKPDDSCYDDCEAGCSALGQADGQRGGELASALCALGCDPNCGGPVLGSINHIDWQISHANDNAESTMTWDICHRAFATELGGCSTGSEQVHDGFWWRIDPNSGACPK